MDAGIGGRLLTGLALLALLAGKGMTSAQASGPEQAPGRVTLELREASLTEAAAALERAFGTRIDPKPALDASPALATRRATFAWNGLSLDRALRDLCARFECWCGGDRDGYRLYPVGPQSKTPYAVSVGGVRVALAGIARYGTRQATFTRPAGGGALRARSDEPQENLLLTVLVDLDDARSDWEVVPQNLEAQDDLGGALRERYPQGPMSKTFPGGRIAFMALPLPRGNARRLEWIRGDLVLSRPRGEVRLELPYPKPGETREASLAEGGAIAVSEARPAAPTPAAAYAAKHPDVPAALLSYPAFDVERGPALLIRVQRPEEQVNPDAGFPAPRAIGRSGRTYPGQASFGGGQMGQGKHLYYTQVYFPGAEEPLEKLVWTFPGKDAGGTRTSFRLGSVPLPPLDSLAVQQQWRQEPESPAADPPPVAPGPFARKGGATLRSSVRLLGKPAPVGVLRIGLSTREADGGWSAAEWSQVPVDANGSSALEGLAPGKYRLLRQYTVAYDVTLGKDWDPTSSPAGRWVNSEVEVEVPAAGDCVPPALELIADPKAPEELRLAAPRRPPAFGWEPVSLRQSHGRATFWEGFAALRIHERSTVFLTSNFTLPEGVNRGAAFLRRVTAMDDQGTLVTSVDTPAGFSGGRRPNTSSLIELTAVHPRARRLRWVEGELYAYRRPRTVRVEVPYPAPGETVLVRESRNLIITVANDAVPPPVAGKEPALIGAGVGTREGPQIRYRICYRDLVLAAVRDGIEGLSPRGIAKSGVELTPRGGGGVGTQVKGWVLHAFRTSYPKAQEPPAKLVWDLNVWEEPERIGVVRLQDVPLASAQATPPGGNQPAATEGPGATLTVRVAGRKLPRQVYLGLSERLADGWGPIRWSAVAVEEEGTARLDGLKPGRYRVLVRAAQGARPAASGPPAQEVTLSRGRETVLPPQGRRREGE